MSTRKWIIISALVGVLALFGVYALASCAQQPKSPASTVEQEDTCDDLEDLVDPEEDDCGVGSDRRKASPKTTKTTPTSGTKATPKKTTQQVTPAKTR